MNRMIMDNLSEHAELRLGSIGQSCHERGWSEGKRHPDYDLWLVTGGEVTIEARGRKSAANEGDIVFFNPGVPYFAACGSGPCSHIYVHFDFSLGERFNFLNEFDLMGVIPKRHFAAEGEQLRRAFDAYRNKEPMASLTLKGYFLTLLAKLLAVPKENASGFKEAVQPSKHFAKLAPVLRYIEEHIGEPIPAERLAEVMGMSPKYFYAFFKANIGLTPQNYVNRIKMNRARDLLLSGKRTVKEVAGQLGYSDPYTFSKIFKRYHHTSPSRLNDHT